MHYLPHFRREVTAFETAARRVVGEPAPLVPSCPGWSVIDLVTHLGRVHRMLTVLIRERFTAPPTAGGSAAQDCAPTVGPVPASLVDWFAEGAEALAGLFGERRPGEEVWSWSQEHTVGFWLRMQTIEAAVHRWDLEGAVGGPVAELDAGLALDTVDQTFAVMVAARRSWRAVPPGSGETFRFRATDEPGDWTILFEQTEARMVEGPAEVTLTGSASNLALFLWHRLSADECGDVDGDRAKLEHYFKLVPPT